MPSAARENAGLVTPFRYAANHVALDLLNTISGVRADRLEHFRSDDDVVRWVIGAAHIQDRRVVYRAAEHAVFRGLLKKAIEYRESLREVCMRVIASRPVGRESLATINAMLLKDPTRSIVSHGRSGVAVTESATLKSAGDVLGCLARLTVTIFETDLSRVRTCANASDCTLFFYDISKSGKRVWCSMKGCGNRAKVHAYRTRNAA